MEGGCDHIILMLKDLKSLVKAVRTLFSSSEEKLRYRETISEKKIKDEPTRWEVRLYSSSYF